MELRHLRYFAAVAEARTITLASARLRVAQPALSRQLQDLEDEIGVDLFRRMPRGVVLTAEGRIFLEAARDILARADAAVEQARALARGEAGEVRVGYSPSLVTGLLPPAIAAFEKAAPKVRLELHDLAAAEMWAGLRAGTLDLALTSRPQDVSMAGLRFERLRSYPICLALAPAHPLARRREIPLEALAAETLVVFRRREYPDYHRLLRQVFGPGVTRMKIGAECDGASSLITEIEAGRGVAVLASVFAQITGARLRFRPVTPEPEALQVGVVTALDAEPTPAVGKFCALLRSFAGENGRRGSGVKSGPKR